MNSVKNVALVSASPKLNEPAVSGWLCARAKKLIEGDGIAVTQLNVRSSLTKKTTRADYDALLSSDALVIIFPLYIFCLPGLLIRYLQDFFAYFEANRKLSRISRIYCAVNCGFPEPGINAEAVRVIESFSRKIGAEFRFGLMIGCGGMLLGASDAPFMKKTLAGIDSAFLRMKTDITTESVSPVQNCEINVRFPRRLYFFMGGVGWNSLAKKNKLKRADLYARPYERTQLCP